jgi:hypothetical protein
MPHLRDQLSVPLQIFDEFLNKRLWIAIEKAWTSGRFWFISPGRTLEPPEVRPQRRPPNKMT